MPPRASNLACPVNLGSPAVARGLTFVTTLLAALIALHIGPLSTTAHAQPTSDPRLGPRFLPRLQPPAGADCDGQIHLQFLGSEPSIAMLFTWGPQAGCGSPDAKPEGLACTGLLNPGQAWPISLDRLPAGAQSAVVYTLASDAGLPDREPGGQPLHVWFCDLMEALLAQDGDAYAEFRAAYEQGGSWQGISMDRARGGPIEVLLRQDCDGPAGGIGSTALQGLAEADLAPAEMQGDRWVYRLPVSPAGAGRIHLQNAGRDCSTLEAWIRTGQPDCAPANPLPCLGVIALGPGERQTVDLRACLPGGEMASLEIHSDGPLAIASEFEGAREAPARHPAPAAAGTILQAPLAIDLSDGWTGQVLVQNQDAERSAEVQLRILDRLGSELVSRRQILCPAQAARLSVDLPAGSSSFGNSLRLESHRLGDPIGGLAPPSISAVVELGREGPVAQRTRYGMHSVDPNPATRADHGLLALPCLRAREDATGRLSIQNQSLDPGFATMAVYLYDANGLLDFLCIELHDHEMAAIDLSSFVQPGFRGSAVISADHWEHIAFQPPQGRHNRLSLAATYAEYPLHDGSPIEAWTQSAERWSALPGPPGSIVPRCVDHVRGGPTPPPTRTPQPPTLPKGLYLPLLLRPSGS